MKLVINMGSSFMKKNFVLHFKILLVLPIIVRLRLKSGWKNILVGEGGLPYREGNL